jgi:pectinesterase
MTRRIGWTLAALGVALAATWTPAPAAGPAATVTVRNPIDLARPSETIVVTGADLARVLTADDLRKIHVRDDKAGQDLLVQALDLDDDGKFDEVVFQSSLGPNEARTFTLTVGERRIAPLGDYRVYGRFVRERRDDFAWENDLVAHRMYGEALETWAQEPLTSSTVDVWCKRTPALVINNWYLVDDYHRDTGQGADFYSAGRSRGVGGNGPWVNGRLWPSGNFRGSRVLANGPIRLVFELTYAPWNVNGQSVTETKRVTLDAGHRFNRFETRYRSAAPLPAEHAIGIKRASGTGVVVGGSREGGVLTSWEPIKGDNGHLALAVVVPDASAVSALTEDDLNRLLVATLPKDGPAVYFAGSAWDRSEAVPKAAPDPAGWTAYVEAFARRVRQPVQVSMAGAAPRQ